MYYDFEKGSGPVRVVDEHEEQLLYQDVDDDNYDDDFSDSTDFEEVGEGGQVTSPTIQTKQKKGKSEIFREQFVEDSQVDMIGELFYCNMYSTISNRISKWVKKYCVARDMHLLCHNGPKKKASLDIPLPGHTVTLAARTAGKKNVLIINHPSKGDQMFSCRSKEEAERWLEVLQDYATMGHEIVPQTGYVAAIETHCATKGKDKEKKNKKEKKKDKKKDKNASISPELTVDDKGNLSGFVNLYGIHFGEPKWKKHWISIKESTFSCHLEPNGISIFSFNLKKTTIDLAEQKSSQDSTTLKIVSGQDTYVLIEPLNMIDSGRLLKSLVAGMTAGAKPEEKQKQSGLVARLMEAFEQSQNEPSFYEPWSSVTSPGCSPPVLSPVESSSPPFTKEYQLKGWSPKKREPSVVYFQARGPSLDEEIEREESVYTNKDILRSRNPELPDNVEELYLEVLADYCQSSREPEENGLMEELPEEDYLDVTPSYSNVTPPRTRLGSLKMPRMNLRLHKNNRPVSAAVKSTEEEEPSKSPPSTDSKTSGKSSSLQRFFSPKSSSNLTVSDDNKSKASSKVSPKPSPKSSPKPSPKVEKKTTVKKSEPGKPDLKLAAKLNEERTAKEAKRKELNQKKKEIRLKKFSLKTDAERDAADEELRAIQKEWNEVNSSLIDLEKKIYMAKSGISTSEETSTNNSNSTATNNGLPGNNWTHKRGSVASRASEINRRMSVLEDGTIGEDEKVTTGTVKNMKSLFQGN
ncbi:Actin filament-associated protein 1 [Holothuria leucospilota]|uniref:Actin filament-associated protein 1 n=1 Tax=Holothuria leucospilota TaxID=206669 RepID=A0A9Q1BCL9_HOLLE|nr:Actin filament-associated protein 1 [Holothuria leucospilota]